MIPAWGGALAKPPRPFDWTAVIGERQLGGGAGRGQPWLTQLSPPPQPLQSEWQEARFRRSRRLDWGGVLGSKRRKDRGQRIGLRVGCSARELC